MARLIVLTTLFNSEEWIGKCIASIRSQTYSDFLCFVTDDMSTDSSVIEAQRAIGEDQRFILVRNLRKLYQGGNYDNVISSEYVDDHDVCVEVDGDDWLPDNGVFGRVVDAYNDKKTWLTYGQFQYADGRPGFAREMAVQGCRQSSFRLTHLRTWKAFLWRSISPSDLYDDTGWYAESAGDQFFMLPMFEMATEAHAKFTPSVNYIYNEDNPLNDHKKNLMLQRGCAARARSRPAYAPLNPAASFITPRRVDLIIKLLYVMYREAKLQTAYALELYEEHLRVWNGFKEYDNPQKNSLNAFLETFNNIIDSMKKGGFDSTYPVPISASGDLLNGSHRIAAAIYTNAAPHIVRTNDPRAGHADCSLAFFRQQGMREEDLDYVALEYSKLRPKTRLVILYPARDPSYDDKAIQQIISVAPIVYEKRFNIDKPQLTKLMSQIYFGEPWLSNVKDELAGAKDKANWCFGDTSLRILQIECEKQDSLDSLKEELRALYGINKSSVHINDTYAETLRLTRIFMNPVSMQYVTYGPLYSDERLSELVRIYKATILEHNLDPELFCITGSSILAMFGLREAQDLDYLHKDPSHIITGHSLIQSHQKELSKYPMHQDDILFNPRRHFHWNETKFASLECLKAMKTHRSEEKDKRDVGLIDKLLR